jgi:hypothetical protein
MFKIEKSLRLPTFNEDVPITLGNGEEFHFRPPRIVQYPRFEGGRIVLCLEVNYGQAFVDRHEAALADDAARDNNAMLEHMFWFADMMLLRNYSEQIRHYYSLLLGVNAYEPDAVRRLMQIWDLARGYDPKGLSSDGSQTRSGSTESTPRG